MKIRSTMITMTAVLGILGVADAAIITSGSVTTALDLDGDYTRTTQFNIGASTGVAGSLTIDNGSTWFQDDDHIVVIGHTGPGTMTISDGGWLNVTHNNTARDGGYYITLGNWGTGPGNVLVTGTDSKITTLGMIRVGRRPATDPADTIASYLTIEDGGMVKAKSIVYGVDAGAKGYVRVGLGGVLAIEGTKTISNIATKGANGIGELQYWDFGSGAWDNITNATQGVHYTLEPGTGDLSGHTELRVIPEPGTVALLGLAGMAMFIRRRFVK